MVLTFVAALFAAVYIALSNDLNPVEWIGALTVLLVATVRPRTAAGFFRWIETRFSVLARRKTLAIVTVSGLALALRALLLPIDPIPEPIVTDEFSHLLLADTLVHGRLANPPHPMWRHFETMHVIQQPRYASMYLPGQGAVLALGRVVGGHPWWGVWFTTGLLCGALTWLLQGCLPPGWALLGGFVAMLRLALFSYWVDSYWGGALAALGGTLVLGAWLRLRGKAYLRYGVLFAAGALTLANTRPYEGGVLCVSVGAALGWQFLRGARRERRADLLRVALPVICILLCGLTVEAVYIRAVTGSPWQLPYTLNQQTYGWPMTAAWIQPRPFAHEHLQMHRYYLWELSLHRHLFDFPVILIKTAQLWCFFIGPTLGLALLFGSRAWRDRRIRALLIFGGLVFFVVLTEQSSYPHYLSPVAGVVFALVLQAMRHVRAGGPRGLALARMLPLVLVFVVGLRAVAAPLHYRFQSLGDHLSWCCNKPGNLNRAAVLARLTAEPGQHVAIVTYSAEHPFLYEWVYNEADIDHAKVVWARDMGIEGNRELVRYFKGRRIWIVSADAIPAPIVEEQKVP
jgi:hypothetical protein